MYAIFKILTAVLLNNHTKNKKCFDQLPKLPIQDIKNLIQNVNSIILINILCICMRQGLTTTIFYLISLGGFVAMMTSGGLVIKPLIHIRFCCSDIKCLPSD